MPNDNVLTIPRDLLQDLIDDVSDYAASREFKPREKVWRDDVLARARALLATPLPEPRAEVTDTARLDWLRDETCDLRCVDIPTGAGDSEVRWVVVQHHMSKPHEREIGRSVTEEPREAIDAARAGEKQ
ncbi:hypothetical protein [Burkholderia vietnamiensis]|uniref:hypothetical protein n=1 Tax=Burkholderia vietnamiensis TaxID=60552 RepID=UPI001B998B7F|nr:hypothetical protein [Burkholderia vietnamiensis]MBR8201655.1 hypothetical protein [Burkholderia vietnamiensis]